MSPSVVLQLALLLYKMGKREFKKGDQKNADATLSTYCDQALSWKVILMGAVAFNARNQSFLEMLLLKYMNLHAFVLSLHIILVTAPANSSKVFLYMLCCLKPQTFAPLRVFSVCFIFHGLFSTTFVLSSFSWQSYSLLQIYLSSS